MKFPQLTALALAAMVGASALPAAAEVMVGGAPMYATKDIVDNAVNSKDHTTLVAAVKAAGLVDTLKGPGPFTVFAPTNAAFATLPAGHRRHAAEAGEQGRPDQGADLPRGRRARWTRRRCKRRSTAGGGKATLTTVSGGTLTATASGSTIMLTDESGGMAHVTIADVMQSNGVIHVVDKVLLPK